MTGQLSMIKTSLNYCLSFLFSCSLVATLSSVSVLTHGNTEHFNKGKNHKKIAHIGPRPSYLVNDMDPSPLKEKLQHCAENKKTYYASDFSVGHRGAALQFPEHTKESYVAAATMGAGIIECDVTFTNDRELVCRHSQCDLHTTTDILLTPLANQCSQPFSPAVFDEVTGELIQAASAMCCTSDISLAEFKTLNGKMDSFNAAAQTKAEFIDGTASWRTDLYANTGTLLTHAESIQLIQRLGAKFTPELKIPSVSMPYDGDYTQEAYASQMINEYRSAGIHPKNVWPQSFDLNDVIYWIENEAAFGKQAVFLDGRYDDASFDHTDPSTYSPTMEELVKSGVNIIAPPLWMLLKSDDGNIQPSTYAKEVKLAGLDIITWSLERSAPLVNDGAWYHQTIDDIINNDGDKLVALDVLAKKVGVIGVFSDWPATTTFYANCMNEY